MRMVEFGCGTGGTAVEHAPFVKEILATDFSENMLEYGRLRLNEAGLSNVTFEAADIASFAVDADNKFDAALCLNLLHLLKSPRGAIANIHALLNPGGIFVSSTFCPGSAWRLLSPLTLLGRAIGLMPFFKFISTIRLQNDLRDAGFEILEKRTYFRGRSQFIIARKVG